MRNDAFYASVSAVLPLLMVATMLEARARVARSLRAIKAADPQTSALLALRAGGRSLRRANALVTAYGVGEVGALGALFFGTDGWRGWLFGPVSALCTLMVLNSALQALHTRVWSAPEPAEAAGEDG